MLRRFPSVALLLIAAAGAASGQTPPDVALPAPCSATPQDLVALEKSKEQLERRIRRSIFAKTKRRRQEQLAKLIFEIECLQSLEREQVVEILPPSNSATTSNRRHHHSYSRHHSHHHSHRHHHSYRRDAPPKSVDSPAPATPPKPALTRSLRRPQNIVEVTTWYATNRMPTGSAEPARFYGAEVASGLAYGRAVVTIPTTHKPGNIELPSVWRLERAPDPERHFVLKEVSRSGLDAVRAEMKARLDGTDTKVVLLFVHGYNVGFAEAAMRTAQLAYDLRFAGVPMFFSWPSAAQTTAYFQDAETAQLSEGAFDQVLEDLAALPATDVYVVAHSMGSRIVTQVLKSRVERGRPTQHLSELLLAAPDINAKLFRDVIAPRLARLERTRTTIYASSSDLALKASRAMHGFERVGDTSGKVFVYKGMETIDASKVSLVMRAFGHSYLMDSKSVLKDLHTIVRERLPANMRGLTETGKLPDLYWRLE